VKQITLQKLLTAALILAALGAAIWRYFSIPGPVREYDGKTSEVTVKVIGFTSMAPYGRQVAVRLNGVSGTLYYTEGRDFTPGDNLTGPFRITLTPRSGSHFKASVYTDIAVEEGVPTLRDRPVIWGQAIKARIQSLYSGGGAALLTGILTGDRSGFPDALNQDLFTAGMTHVAAVSGLHVSMLAGFAALVMRSRRRSFIVSLPLVFLYVAITGFTPSAVRAGIMITVFLIAPLAGREYNALRALVFAFLVLCVMEPYAVFEPGLQLSFSATLGLLLFASKWQKALDARFLKIHIPRRAARYLASSLAASFAALVFSTPFAAYWFGGASLLAPLANLLLLWLVNAIFIGGAVSLLLTPLAPLVSLFLAVFQGALRLLGGIPYAMLYTAQPYMFAWLLYAYAIFVILILSRRWKAPVLLAASALIICLLMTVWRDGRFALEIAALDVGQGQCVIVRSGGQTAVIDCGGSVNAGREAARYLQSRGVRTVEHLLLSHYDADHINGVPALLETVPVERILGPALDNVPDALPVRTLTQAVAFTLGSAEVTVIPTHWLGGGNDQCMTVLVTLDGFSFLVTGDLGAPGERWLLRQTGLRHTDVLMAGHHGSAGSTSEEFLDALSPQAALISVGSNRYGHPSPQTLERLFERETAVYRTDRSGHVIIRV
jgi:competence protein ComEC